MQRWADKVIKTLLVVTQCLLSTAWAGSGHDLTLRGEVMLEDNTPVAHGEVQVTELRNRFLSKPAIAHQYVTHTDEQGRFVLELKSVKGDLDIRLRESACHWNGALTYIRASEHKGLSEVLVRFTPSQGPWLEDCTVQESARPDETTQRH